jgi:hypothetical protein
MKLSGIRCRLFEKDTLQEKNECWLSTLTAGRAGKVKTVSVDSFEQTTLSLLMKA